MSFLLLRARRKIVPLLPLGVLGGLGAKREEKIEFVMEFEIQFFSVAERPPNVLAYFLNAKKVGRRRLVIGPAKAGAFLFSHTRLPSPPRPLLPFGRISPAAKPGWPVTGPAFWVCRANVAAAPRRGPNGKTPALFGYFLNIKKVTPSADFVISPAKAGVFLFPTRGFRSRRPFLRHRRAHPREEPRAALHGHSRAGQTARHATAHKLHAGQRLLR